MTLPNETIEVMLEQLKKNQEDLKEDYSKKIDLLGEKIDKLSEKIDNLPQNYVTRGEFDYCKDKIKTMEDRWNKIIWIIITAVIGAVLSLVLIQK
jgi:chromosome segregation ATPase